MARIVKVVVRKIHCDRLNRDASLVEDRIYPSDVIPEIGDSFHIKVRTCSLGAECRRIGHVCKWTKLNSTYDPFEGELPPGRLTEADSSGAAGHMGHGGD